MPDKKHNWTDEQKKLLLECIEGKWALLIEEPDADESECNLCLAYQDSGDDERECKKCPVAVYANTTHCYGTPYYGFHYDLMRVEEYVSGISEDKKVAGMARLKQLATAERDFLREVLEAGS